MSTASRPTKPVLVPGAFGTRPAISGASIRWSVARSAVSSAGPAGDSRMITLELSVRFTDAWPACELIATLLDPASGATITVDRAGGVACEIIPDIRGELHLEIPGWLYATIAPGAHDDGDARSWRLLYARSPILGRLGVPGGRAEPVGVRVDAR